MDVSSVNDWLVVTFLHVHAQWSLDYELAAVLAFVPREDFSFVFRYLTARGVVRRKRFLDVSGMQETLSCVMKAEAGTRVAFAVRVFLGKAVDAVVVLADVVVVDVVIVAV